jgi:hypothetical protein
VLNSDDSVICVGRRSLALPEYWPAYHRKGLDKAFLATRMG